MSPLTSPEIIASLLVEWFRVHARALPWRGRADPWGVWVSEIMCQQTRVDSAIPYWTRFMARYPTPSHLAAAPVDEVLALWAGLGYYARARNLRRAAQAVVERFDGQVPSDPTEFGRLSGVGRYTRGAVQSIAFGHREPAVDGNATRVLCRIDLVETDPRRTDTQRRLWARAAELVERERPGDVNQALMELGATLCLPRGPRCPVCPLAQRCLAYHAGAQDTLPVKSRPPRRRPVCVVAGLVRQESEIWLARRPESGLLGGLWELPGLEVPRPDPSALACLGLTATGEPRTVRHAFTHLEWSLHVYLAEGQPIGGPYTDRALVFLDRLADVALTGPSLKALRAWGVDGVPLRRGAGRDRSTDPR